MLRSGFLGVLGNNGFSKGMFIYMYIHINSNSIFNQFCKCAIISQESANCRWVIILEQYHIYHWKSTRSQVLLKLYSIIGITKIYTITWTILKMFNITGTLSHVLVKCTIFPVHVLLIMYKSLVCYLLVCLWNGQWENIDWFKWQRSYSIVSQLQWIITGGNYLEKRNT